VETIVIGSDPTQIELPCTNVVEVVIPYRITSRPVGEVDYTLVVDNTGSISIIIDPDC
jgi:hypothetical protein